MKWPERKKNEKDLMERCAFAFGVPSAVHNIIEIVV